MRIVCAWCGTQIGEHKGVKEKEVSHGICPPCMFVQSPVTAVEYWLKKHPQDAPALALALLAGAFLCWWFANGGLPCVG